MALAADEATTGRTYRRTKTSSVEKWRGYSVLVLPSPDETRKTIEKMRGARQDSRETWLVHMVKGGAILFWRYIRRGSAVVREPVALPQDCRLREVRPPTWLPQSRREKTPTPTRRKGQ
jgi:hypothetical protein